MTEGFNRYADDGYDYPSGDETPMESALSRLTDRERKELDFAHQSFLDSRISQDELDAWLKFQLGWNADARLEYVNAACDACDGAPPVPASPNAQLAPQSPVERPRRILTPNYGTRQPR